MNRVLESWKAGGDKQISKFIMRPMNLQLKNSQNALAIFATVGRQTKPLVSVAPEHALTLPHFTDKI